MRLTFPHLALYLILVPITVGLNWFPRYQFLKMTDRGAASISTNWPGWMGSAYTEGPKRTVSVKSAFPLQVRKGHSGFRPQPVSAQAASQRSPGNGTALAQLRWAPGCSGRLTWSLEGSTNWWSVGERILHLWTLKEIWWEFLWDVSWMLLYENRANLAVRLHLSRKLYINTNTTRLRYFGNVGSGNFEFYS